MKVAIVYDRVNKFGGAEQVLLALHTIWPNAPLYTAVYNKQKAVWADVFHVHHSFLQSFPLASSHHELYPWLTPLAFESFSFSDYDVVISVTSAEAKSIITKSETLHICYCLTPTRYLWSGYDTYMSEPGLGSVSSIAKIVLPKIVKTLRQWDYYAAKRPDYYIAISQHVKTRVEKYYKETVSEVIYPPVDTTTFTISSNTVNNDAPYLVVSRLVPYKRIDLVIQACNKLKLPLVVIGDGKDRKRLMSLAGSTIRFVTDKLTDSELAEYYQVCKAFVFAGEEDFGIVAAEAQACGKPVLCYENSGMAEIIHQGVTGEVFSDQTLESVSMSLSRFKPDTYDPNLCRKRALLFDSHAFCHQMKSFVDKAYNEYKQTYI